MSKLKLELKHIAPYLPYGLKGVLIHDVRDEFTDEDWCEDVEIFNKGVIWQYAGYVDEDLALPMGEGEFSGFLVRKENTYTPVDYYIKPILRPLKEIKDIEEIMDEFSEYSWEVFENHFFVLGRTLNCFDSITYTIAELCFKHHIDLFDLINKGLAIDINNLKK